MSCALRRYPLVVTGAADLPSSHHPIQHRRMLNLNEIVYFATIFGNHIDYSEVRVSRREIPEPFHFAGGYTSGSTIYVSPLRYRWDYTKYVVGEDFWMDDVATIVRELCHVWQSQAHVPGFSDAALKREHHDLGLDVYKYSIDGAKRLIDYRFEQQCQIMFDYLYVRAFNDPLITTFDSVVRKDLDLDTVLPLNEARSRVPQLNKVEH